MKREYVIISEEIKNAWQDVTVGVNTFHAVQNKEGQWVVDKNALADFPQAFEGYEIQQTELGLENFELEKQPPLWHAVKKK